MFHFLLMLHSYKSKFAELIAPFFQLSNEEILPLVQLAPENVP